MGALGPVTPWLPEDDVLLKNAVEGGASLESLAKGAVQFSRKFTVREIKERWHSLLYDPVVSAEAASHMIDFERSATSLPPKFNRAGNSKENKSLSVKRKAQSVRSCYYALCKRIRNEPFNSMDLSFLVGPNSNYIGNEGEPLSGNCMLGDLVSNDFGLQESNLDIMNHAFPEIGGGDPANTFHAQFQNTVKGDCCMEQDDLHKELPHMLEENMSHSRNQFIVEEFGQPKELKVTGDQAHRCSRFNGNGVFRSPIPECGSSFHALEYSSPLPEIPIWGTEGISSPDIAADLGLVGKDLHAGDTFSLPGDDDTKNTCPSGYDVVHVESNLKLEIPSGELKNTTGTGGYLAELSDPPLDFANDDELLFLDVDGKDVIDKSYYDGLSSLLLSSPNDISQVDMPIIAELESSVSPDNLATQSVSCPRKLDEDIKCHNSGDVGCNSNVEVLTSDSKYQFPELVDGVICCVLNSEDPEIPCNDDIVFTNRLCPISFSSVPQLSFQDAGKQNYSSVKEISGNQQNTEVGKLFMQRDRQNPGQSCASSQMTRSQVMPETSFLHPVGDHGDKFEFPNSQSIHRAAGILYQSSALVKSANASMETIVSSKHKGETSETAVLKHLIHKQAPDASGIKQGSDAPARVHNHQTSYANGSRGIDASGPVVNDPVPDTEEPPVESDDDVPYFSDIEAMILDMDLDPEDHDLNCSEEVLRYQQEDTKRTIIRLEQSVHSYMQRAVASHGAFAILYGRHSKHYIKKPQVVLGRATEDVFVDIDMGREGCANKISRRQAIIALDKNGSFHLKNLGKCSISVNGKEVAHGQRVTLTSSCLIEIRRIAFIFETNQTCVKQFLDSKRLKNQNQKHQI